MPVRHTRLYSHTLKPNFIQWSHVTKNCHGVQSFNFGSPRNFLSFRNLKVPNHIQKTLPPHKILSQLKQDHTVTVTRTSLRPLQVPTCSLYQSLQGDLFSTVFFFTQRFVGLSHYHEHHLPWINSVCNIWMSSSLCIFLYVRITASV